MANRLKDSLSPYLRQHADNPVDWFEWGEEAFAEAARRQVPVFLSVGYAACHWCHVMAHESFEDPATADALNQHFVAVKVDREERPDVDAVYMQATQGLTGQGGWPMSVFLTPERLPFFAGTYFPPAPRHGMPSFRQVLGAVNEAWTERRDEVHRSASTIVGELAKRQIGAVPGTMTEADCAAAVTRLQGEFDAATGGFGGAPKFPPSMVLEALLRDGERAGDDDGGADRDRDGPGRHLRPAGRRFRALQRRRRLGGAALREDALRQRAAAGRVHALVAAHRQPAGRAGRGRDRRLAAHRDAYAATAPSPPAWTPTRWTRTATCTKARTTSGPRTS